MVSSSKRRGGEKRKGRAEDGEMRGRILLTISVFQVHKEVRFGPNLSYGTFFLVPRICV
jgi:hypothetical protein